MHFDSIRAWISGSVTAACAYLLFATLLHAYHLRSIDYDNEITFHQLDRGEKIRAPGSLIFRLPRLKKSRNSVLEVVVYKLLSYIVRA
ncbi:unnamed protein product [Hermetia illucens]|uniref:Uncharacterized protein n=1 Tax=Hermetia illucens TaxID=343691 RepID=A0A7R8UJK5_HERIL|nr:unnamed protein product [Hermetia illucens]